MNFECSLIHKHPKYQRFICVRKRLVDGKTICDSCVENNKTTITGYDLIKEFKLNEKDVKEKCREYYYNPFLNIRDPKNHYYLIKNIDEVKNSKKYLDYCNKYNLLKNIILQLHEKYDLKKDNYFDHFVHNEIVKTIDEKKPNVVYDISTAIKILNNVKITIKENEEKCNHNNNIKILLKKFDETINNTENIKYINKNILEIYKKKFETINSTEIVLSLDVLINHTIQIANKSREISELLKIENVI
jgi:hypothetical protein